MTAIDATDSEYAAWTDQAERNAAASAWHRACFWFGDTGRPVGYITELPGVFWAAAEGETAEQAVARTVRDHYGAPQEVQPRVRLLRIDPPEPTP